MFRAERVYVCVNVYFCRHEITAALFPTKCPAASLYFALSPQLRSLPFTKQNTKGRKTAKKCSLRFFVQSGFFLRVGISFCISPTGVSIWFYVGQFDMESVLLWRMALIVNISLRIISMCRCTKSICARLVCMCVYASAYFVSISHNNFIRDRVKSKTKTVFSLVEHHMAC